MQKHDSPLLIEEGNDICSICIDTIQIEYIYFKCSNCKQNIHFDCLLEWFKKKREIICPVCKNKINILNQNLVNIDSEYFQKNKIITIDDIFKNLEKIRKDYNLGPVYNNTEIDNNITSNNNINNNFFYNLYVKCHDCWYYHRDRFRYWGIFKECECFCAIFILILCFIIVYEIECLVSKKCFPYYFNNTNYTNYTNLKK